MNEKAIDCLNYAAMELCSEERMDKYEQLCAKYSEKALRRKLEKLMDEGYVEYGVGPGGAWLTEKGEETLAILGS
jgi:repressor of nif and glnA expression